MTERAQGGADGDERGDAEVAAGRGRGKSPRNSDGESTSTDVDTGPRPDAAGLATRGDRDADGEREAAADADASAAMIWEGAAAPLPNPPTKPPPDSATAEPSRPRSFFHGALDASIVAFALLLRLYRADAQSLWYDEGTSAALAGRSAAEILVAAANDAHPPLYYLLLAGWSRLFGDGVVALRSLSAVFGALTVLGVMLVARRAAPRHPAIAWMAGLLTATSPFLVWYGQEVRMYALAAALGTLLLALTLHALMVDDGADDGDGEGNARPDASPPSTTPVALWLAVTASTTAALYTHYVSGASAVLAANLIAAGLLLGRRRRSGQWPWRAALAWSATQIVSIALFLPWLAAAWPTLSTWPAVGEGMSAYDIFDATYRTYHHGTRSAEGLPNWFTLLTFTIGIGFGRLFYSRSFRRLLYIALTWTYAPALLISVLGLRNPTWKPKFVLVGAPGFELVLALGIVGFAVLAIVPFRAGYKRWGVLLALIFGAIIYRDIVVTRTGYLRANYFDPAYQRDDYRGAIEEIAALAGPDDAVLLVAPTQVELFDFYAPEGLTRIPLPLERPPTLVDVHAQLGVIADTHPNLHALFYAEQEADPGGIIEGWLDSYLAQATERWRGDVRQAMWTSCGLGPLEQPPASEQAPPVIVEFGEQIGIGNVRPIATSAQPGDTVCLAWTWIPLGWQRSDVHVFWQLIDDTGRVVAQRPDMAPRNGRVRTSGWGIPHPIGSFDVRPLRDRMALLLPVDLTPGTYHPIVGLYDPDSGDRLAISGPSGTSTLSLDAPFQIGAPPDHLRLPDLEVR